MNVTTILMKNLSFNSLIFPIETNFEKDKLLFKKVTYLAMTNENIPLKNHEIFKSRALYKQD